MALTKKQIENTRLAYSLMAGIPAKRIDLDVVRGHDANENANIPDKQLRSDCGTVACIAGWLSAHPTFKRQGLTWGGKHCTVSIRGNTYGALSEAGSELMGSGYIFMGSDDGNQNQKLEALKRLREHLHEAGAISDKRNDELAAAEPALCK